MSTVAPGQLSLETFERFRRLIHEKTGIWMRDGKQILVSNRLRRRLLALGLESYEDYLELLQTRGRASHGASEMASFIDAVSTNETYFYRESGHFAVLESVVLPGLLRCSRPVRIWSAGSSTGEEAYTLRIVCDEAVRRHGGSVKITGTDINTSVVAAAREGVYRERSVRLVIPEVLQRCFESVDGEAWRLRRELRERVDFRVHNLLADPIPAEAPFDIIFCRNVMIYFDKPTQARLVDDVFARAIHPRGWLFIGHAESLSGTSERFAYRSVALEGAARTRAPVYRLADAGGGAS